MKFPSSYKYRKEKTTTAKGVSPMKQKKASFKKLVPVLLGALLLCSCSAASKTANGSAFRDTMDESFAPSDSGEGFYERSTIYNAADRDFDILEPEQQKSDSVASSGESSYEERKIIYSSWIDISTKEYDAAIEKLNALCKKYGAYFESAQSYGEKTYSNRYANYTVRVPNEHYTEFLESAGTLGTVTGSGENNRDVTEQYFDTQARLDSARLREERLLAILEKADTLDDVLLLERELSDVRYEIESMTGELKKLDSLISYSTATISITEVRTDILPDSDKQSLSTRLSLSLERGWQSFCDGLSDFAVEAVYALPVLLCVWLPILIVLLVLILVLRKKRKKRRAAKNSAMNAPVSAPSAPAKGSDTPNEL